MITEVRTGAYNFFHTGKGRLRKARFVGAVVGGFALLGGTSNWAAKKIFPERIMAQITGCQSVDTAKLRCLLKITGENVDFLRRPPSPSGLKIKNIRSIAKRTSDTASYEFEFDARGMDRTTFHLANYPWYYGVISR